jgi:hypothetical protein
MASTAITSAYCAAKHALKGFNDSHWFLYHALKKRGFRERAKRLRRALWQSIERSGLREYYDPFTGEGHGAREFTWSGLLVDKLD